jgi:hypothetical protein
VGVAVLLVLTAVAWLGRPGDPGRPADLSAAASRGGDATTTTGAAVTTTAAKASDDGPKNLLANASFEDGSRGWSPVGDARLTRSTDATEGAWSLRILAEDAADGPVGITVPDATLTQLQGRYHTNAWVRPSSPGATVTIGLREYKDGRPVPGSTPSGGRPSRPAGASSAPSTSPPRPGRGWPSRSWPATCPPAATSTSTRSSSIGCEAAPSGPQGKEGRCVGSGFLRWRAPCCCSDC